MRRPNRVGCSLIWAVLWPVAWLAANAGLVLREIAEMPANNMIVVFERRQAD